MRLDTKKAIVLWTGGKDSSLSLYKAKLLGYDVISLFTFMPSREEFLAHPLKFMKYQADALGIPHHSIEVNEPFRDSYEKAIHSLREKYKIDVLVTGDIAEVNGHPNWIRECSRHSGTDVLTPLWGFDRLVILKELLSYKFKIIFSCVKKPWFTIDWLGKELNLNSLDQMRTISAETGLDMCGENGEYHTLVVDGPLFKKNIYIEKYSRQIKNSLMYLDIRSVVLREKFS